MQISRRNALVGASTAAVVAGVPVAALGIGLGVDYAFYVADGIREELRETRDPMGAIIKALHSDRSGSAGIEAPMPLSIPITKGLDQSPYGGGLTKMVSMSAYMPPNRASTSSRITSAWWA